MNMSNELKILVVDDEPIVRHTLKAFLKHLGHQVEAVADGLSGLQALENTDYDATFADIRMPGLDGISFLSQTKTIRPDMPVIIITGHGCDETQKEAMEAGAFAFLSKPFQFMDIQDVMKRVDGLKTPCTCGCG